MSFPPYLGAAVAAVLSLITALGVAVQVISQGEVQVPSLVMQAAMAMMWGAMALRFWNKGRVARLTRREPPLVNFSAPLACSAVSF